MIEAAGGPSGRFYTPAPLAERVVRRALAPLVEGVDRAAILRLRVCDPACGEGVFLLEARRFLAERAHVPAREVEPCLVGVDLDRAALARARAGLPGAELLCADALAMDWEGRHFDAVIGNPPWVSYSGRRAVALPERRRRMLAARFESFRGWPSLHGPFLELAVRLARHRVALLLPTQVLDLDGYGAMRAFVRSHCRVDEVLDLGEGSFRGVVQPCCALLLARTAAGSVGGAAPFRAVAHEDIGRFAGLRRPPPDAFADIGVHTGNCAGKLLRTRGLPIREGRDVHPYRLGRARKHFDPAARLGPGEYFRAAPLARYREIPILLRQTAARPIAALHTDAQYFRNSVLACRGLPGLPHEVAVAWLNASVVAHYHAAGVREAGQIAFPQVKLKHLRDLPLPRAEDAPPGLFRLAREVARAGRADLEPELDRLVSAWFGLDAAAHARVRTAAHASGRTAAGA